MKIYQYDGGLYCAPCGEAIAATLPEPDAWEREHPDTCSYPVAYDSSAGESDSPDHCGECDLHLERNLTEDGVRYVRDYMDTLDGDTDITLLWGEFYGIAKATEEVNA
jgi:hypothetical protein